MKSYKKAHERLYETAAAQQGYFTAKQAIAAGYADNTHPFHVKSGNWIRECRGAYRLAKYPQPERPDLMRWFLWSRGRDDRPQGVYSHQTALSIYELSDVMPSKIHMTVPPNFHRNGPIPKILVLHWSKLHPSEIESIQGVRVTRPIRAVSDLLRNGSVSSDFIQQAIAGALKRGLLSRSEIQKSIRLSKTARRKIAAMIEEPAR